MRCGTPDANIAFSFAGKRKVAGPGEKLVLRNSAPISRSRMAAVERSVSVPNQRGFTSAAISSRASIILTEVWGSTVLVDAQVS